MNAIDIAQVVTHSYRNRTEIQQSDRCLCFSCLSLFTPATIVYWTDSDDEHDDDPGRLRDESDKFIGLTAICPYCENDSVIGSASGYCITKELGEEINAYWHKGRIEVIRS